MRKRFDDPAPMPDLLRGAAAALLLATLAVAGSACAAPAGAASASLTIANASAGSVLRCQLVLAHFVTLALEPVAAGRRLTIALARAPDGTLLVDPDGDRPMAIENLLCGLDNDWHGTKNDPGLTRLRDGGTRHLTIVCAERGEGARGHGLTCAAAGP